MLFDHELFHIHHRAVCPDLTREPHPLWHALWAEGLATHVSEVLNPAAPRPVVLGRPHDLEQRAAGSMPRLVAEIVAKLDSTEHADYATYFYGIDDRDGLPARSGYYVGYLVARDLCVASDLPAAARWSGGPLRVRIQEALTRLDGHTAT